MKLLVSCCNENGGLFVIDTENKKVERKTTKHYQSGRTGLAKTNGTIYSATPSCIYSYLYKNQNLILKEHWSGLTGWDIHDIKYFNEYLYIVQTGGNRVVKIPTSGQEVLETVWVLDERQSDEKHVNSLLVKDDNYIVSYFTKDKKDRPWKEVVGEGEILSLDKELSYTNLKHPHSLTWDVDGSILFCESFSNKLWKNDKVILKDVVNGYLRGLLATKKYYFVGSSRSKNHHNTIFDCKNPTIYQISKESLKKINCFEIADAIEIYDIILLEE
jgi:hypothetical protein